MIDRSFDTLIKKSGKKWKKVPDAPRAKLIQLKKIYSKNPIVAETLDLYEFFRDVEKLEKKRENEFRKGVNLRVIYNGNEVNVDLEKLSEYSSILERFISYLK
jgi:hypothetical protein